MAADLQSFLQVVINLFLLDILDLGLYWQWWWWVQLSVNWGTISHLTERWTLGKDSSWLKGWEKGKLLELANFLFNSVTSKKKSLTLRTISTLFHHHPYMIIQEVERSGVHPEGTTLANSEMSGGNDISLIYPWLHISARFLSNLWWWWL